MLQIFSHVFFVFILSYFTNHSILTLDFYTIHTRRIYTVFWNKLQIFIIIHFSPMNFRNERQVWAKMKFVSLIELTYLWYKGRQVNGKHSIQLD